MKRAFLSVSAAAVALSIAGTVAPAPVPSSAGKKPSAAAHKDKPAPRLSKWQQHIQDMLKTSAPGDEYFGRMKMSYLGINNTFRDDLIRAGAYTTDPHIVSGISFADEALTDWAKKYPNDPQLARSYFLAFQMYRKVWMHEYQDKAWNYAHIVIKKWPSSFFGKTLKKDLEIGFTEHYFADPLPCPVPTAQPTGKVSATPSPSPSPVPTPTPTPTPAPGQPKAEILPAPCIAPTPVPTLPPSPLPTGSALPSPLPTGSVLPSPLPTGSLLPSPRPSGTPVPGPSISPIPRGTPVSATPTPMPTHHP